MYPVKSPRLLFQDQFYSKEVAVNVFPLLSLRSLLSFSAVSKNCQLLWKKYYTENKNFLDPSIHKEALRIGKLTYKLLPLKCDETIGSCQRAINRKSLFIYRTVISEKKNTRSSTIYVEHYNVDDLKLLQLIKVPVPMNNDLVQKLVPIDKKLYMHCINYFSPNPEIGVNSFLIVDLECPLQKKKGYYETKKIELRSYGKVFEVFGDRIITTGKIGTLEFYDRYRGTLLSSKELETSREEHRIVAVTIDKGLKIENEDHLKMLYVRQAHGILSIYNLESEKIIRTIKGGPSCEHNEEHFEVLEGRYLYTINGLMFRRWKFIKAEELNEIVLINEICIGASLIYSFTFQMDHKILYMGYPFTSAGAYHPITLDRFCNFSQYTSETAFSRHTWKRYLIVNDGVLLFIEYTGHFQKGFKQQILVIDLNEITKKYLDEESTLVKKKKKKSKLFASNR